MSRPRLLIEDWLPVQALSVECMRERGASSALPPINFLHVWWARRPLTISRAAVLGSLLPADFDRGIFERLLGFGKSSDELVRIRALMDSGVRVEGGFGADRAFTSIINKPDLEQAYRGMIALWGDIPAVIDPMAGGGSIPFEAERLGLRVLANELNPVACSVLEATLDYPFRFSGSLADKTRLWGKEWEKRCAKRLEPFYPRESFALVHAYIYARTVPCPDTQLPTPLVPDWSLSRVAGKTQIVAEPFVTDPDRGKWTIRVREVGKGAGQLRQSPQPTYSRGAGISLFTKTVISSDYVKAMAQTGRMGSVLYAVGVKAKKLEFRPADEADVGALDDSQRELGRLRPKWERDGIIPTEEYPEVSTDPRPRLYGMPRWSDMFSPRQLLAMGTLVEELRCLRPEIVAKEGNEVGEAVIHLLAMGLDKFADYNSMQATWESTRLIVKHGFQRHDFSFKATFGEMAACVAGSGLEWTIDNVLDAFEKLAQLPRAENARPVLVTQGTATNLVDIEDRSVTAVVVDPPYADNVQYSELADFFYVWLKRTQGHRRPEWYGTYLCDKDDEAVVNVPRHNGKVSPGQARREAHEFYQRLMTDSFLEAHRVLRDDGVLTVMFTHKRQEAWAALFESLTRAGFTITATFPVQTESQHSLHQARKNAAQSTVLLVARKREPDAGRRYYDEGMQDEIRQAARAAATRLKAEGLNAVDQLVGTFGPAMEVFSRYDEVRMDTGDPVSVEAAIQLAADEVAEWRVQQLAERGLEGVDADSRFYLLCWDVLGAAEFRFNEASLLGKAVGMDVSTLKDTGLVTTGSDKVKMIPAAARRRDKPVKSEQDQLTLFGVAGRGRRRPSRQIHPQDEYFVSAVDMCQALVLRYLESGGGDAGIGGAQGMARQMGWGADSPCARLMTALVNAAPVAVQFPGKGRQKTAADEFPEFRAWHEMLKPLFGIEPPEWKEPVILQGLLNLEDEDEEEEPEEE